MTHVLYLSNWPFTNWTFESDTILLTVQMVFNLSFMNITYTLSLQDAIVKAAYNWMKMRRSKIASDVLQLVKTFFEGPQFENREDIKAYMFWALWSGGPAYYETPILKSCRFKIDDPKLPVRSYMSLAAKSALEHTVGPLCNDPDCISVVIHNLTILEELHTTTNPLSHHIVYFVLVFEFVAKNAKIQMGHLSFPERSPSWHHSCCLHHYIRCAFTMSTSLRPIEWTFGLWVSPEGKALVMAVNLNYFFATIDLGEVHSATKFQNMALEKTRLVGGGWGRQD
ncbi:hypothetical protein EI94DRAFT_1710172 [Lactarius quietus]|nr:hypothetical protein EI94DRAFT_1710172 [Lactarius quietus]